MPTLRQAERLQEILVDRATGEPADPDEFKTLRALFMAETSTRAIVPDFVRDSRSLDQYWAHIKHAAPSYAERRSIIYNAFAPLFRHLEEAASNVPDDIVPTLSALESDAVTAIWQKALARRDTDPEGAITVARQLLESVCKHILDDLEVPYSDKDDLPKLWKACGEKLQLSPDQHTEPLFKSILGSAHNIVQSIGTVRNRASDAHGAGRKYVRPAPRHARLVVNLAGSMATFLVETYQSRRAPPSS